MVKIYFAGSIRGGRSDAELYSKIVDHLKNYGEILTEHVADKDLKVFGEEGLTDEYIHERDLEWLGDSDILVAEVTTPSLGVGYEIARIVERNLWLPEDKKKKILCLYRPREGKRLSGMIAGCKEVKNAEYSDIEEAKKVIDDFFKNSNQQV